MAEEASRSAAGQAAGTRRRNWALGLAIAAAVGVIGVVAMLSVGGGQAEVCQGARKDPKAAIAACTALIEAGGGTAARVAALINRGEANLALDWMDNATKDFQSALDLDPHNVAAFMGRGRAQMKLGEKFGALTSFRQAVRLDPDNIEALSLRGLATYTFGRGDEAAMADFDEAIRRDPTHAPTFHRRGWMHEDRDEAEQAIADYDEAIRLDPAVGGFWASRCRVRAIKGIDLPRALADCDEALRLESDNASALRGRGQIFLKTNRLERGLADFEQALKVDRNNLSALFGRGLARRLMGDEGGNKDMRDAVDGSPHVMEEYEGYYEGVGKISFR